MAPARLAGILASSTNGVIVNAGCRRRGRHTQSRYSGNQWGHIGINGIRYLAGKELHLDRVVVQEFATLCVDVNKVGAMAPCSSGTATLRNARQGSTLPALAQPSPRLTTASSWAWPTTASRLPVRRSSPPSAIRCCPASPGPACSVTSGTMNATNNVISNNITGISSGAGTNLRTVEQRSVRQHHRDLLRRNLGIRRQQQGRRRNDDQHRLLVGDAAEVIGRLSATSYCNKAPDGSPVRRFFCRHPNGRGPAVDATRAGTRVRLGRFLRYPGLIFRDRRMADERWADTVILVSIGSVRCWLRRLRFPVA